MTINPGSDHDKHLRVTAYRAAHLIIRQLAKGDDQAAAIYLAESLQRADKARIGPEYTVALAMALGSEAAAFLNQLTGSNQAENTRYLKGRLDLEQLETNYGDDFE